MLSARPRWLVGGGVGLRWPDLDEDLSIAGLLRGNAPTSAAQVVDRADSPVTEHAYLSAGDTPYASGDRAYRGCFLCGRPRKDHPL